MMGESKNICCYLLHFFRKKKIYFFQKEWLPWTDRGQTVERLRIVVERPKIVMERPRIVVDTPPKKYHQTSAFKRFHITQGIFDDASPCALVRGGSRVGEPEFHVLCVCSSQQWKCYRHRSDHGIIFISLSLLKIASSINHQHRLAGTGGLPFWDMADTAEAFLAKARARESSHGAASGARRASSAESVASTYIEGFTNHEAFAEDFYQGQAEKQKRRDEKKMRNGLQCPSQPNCT